MSKSIKVTPPDPFASTGNQALDGLLAYIAKIDDTDPAKAVKQIKGAAVAAIAARANAVVKVEEQPTP